MRSAPGRALFAFLAVAGAWPAVLPAAQGPLASVPAPAYNPAALPSREPSGASPVYDDVVVLPKSSNRLVYIGVGVGVLVAMTLFARRVAHLTETHRELVEGRDGTTSAVYRVTGELFFASSNDLYTQFDYAGDPPHVVIDLSRSHVWDASTVASLHGRPSIAASAAAARLGVAAIPP